jgi:hypothetical protein
MSEFSDAWLGCMRGNNFPVIDAETVEDAIEFVDDIHEKWELAGGDEKVTIGALIAAGAFVGVDEGALKVLGAAAQIVFVAYVTACISCMATVALGDLKNLFAQGKLQDFVVAELDDENVDVGQAKA